MSNLKLETSAFIVSEKQMALDMEMVLFDIWGTKAHVLMLLKQNIVDQNTAKKCLRALLEIEKEVKAGKFAINPEKGAQLTLEEKIIEKAGDAGYSVHTGRSRNDQVMVAELLYLREEMLRICLATTSLLKTLLELAAKHQQTIMPGYTHMQPAKITTVGQWALAYSHGLLRALETLKYYFDLYDMNPLGACESYGTSWPLDRKFTTQYLGFSKIWELPQDAIGSRGFAQLGYLTALSEICLVASKLNEDLILFNTYEYGVVELGDEISQRMHPITGSSVMAQKRNPDVLELIRSTVPQIIGFWAIIANTLASLPMGYNRDTRETKEFIHLGLNKTTSVIKTLQKVLASLKINEKRMLELATYNYSLTTDLADCVSQKTGIGYRTVYKIVGQAVNQAIASNKPFNQISANEIKSIAKKFNLDIRLTDAEIAEAITPDKVIAKRKHIGGSNQDIMKNSLNLAVKSIEKNKSWVTNKTEMISKARNKTEVLVKKIVANG
ncbi:MAG: argininosuccinate lyase [bacterium]|nr:argininosuccinate lyase [bacterium]